MQTQFKQLLSSLINSTKGGERGVAKRLAVLEQVRLNSFAINEPTIKSDLESCEIKQ